MLIIYFYNQFKKSIPLINLFIYPYFLLYFSLGKLKWSPLRFGEINGFPFPMLFGIGLPKCFWDMYLKLCKKCVSVHLCKNNHKIGTL